MYGNFSFFSIFKTSLQNSSFIFRAPWWTTVVWLLSVAPAHSVNSNGTWILWNSRRALCNFRNSSSKNSLLSSYLYQQLLVHSITEIVWHALLATRKKRSNELEEKWMKLFYKLHSFCFIFIRQITWQKNFVFIQFLWL